MLVSALRKIPSSSTPTTRTSTNRLRINVFLFSINDNTHIGVGSARNSTMTKSRMSMFDRTNTRTNTNRLRINVFLFSINDNTRNLFLINDNTRNLFSINNNTHIGMGFGTNKLFLFIGTQTKIDQINVGHVIIGATNFKKFLQPSDVTLCSSCHCSKTR